MMTVFTMFSSLYNVSVRYNVFACLQSLSLKPDWASSSLDRVWGDISCVYRRKDVILMTLVGADTGHSPTHSGAGTSAMSPAPHPRLYQLGAALSASSPSPGESQSTSIEQQPLLLQCKTWQTLNYKESLETLLSAIDLWTSVYLFIVKKTCFNTKQAELGLKKILLSLLVRHGVINSRHATCEIIWSNWKHFV